jgi:hypothetical protein
VQQQRRVVYAAAAPEGVNAEQVADLIAAAPLDDGREYDSRGKVFRKRRRAHANGVQEQIW